MTVQLSKGQNAPLDASTVVVTVDVPATADLSALLVNQDGKVRSDADFVFYNQPQGPGVRCVPPAAGQPWQVHVDLTQIPAQIEAVRLVTSLDDGGRTFGQLPSAPVAHVRDASGAALVEAPLGGLSTESIVIAVELYRRAGAWKVRNVAQGYAGGLADLIRDHGVSVDDAPSTPAPSAPAISTPAPSAPVAAPPVAAPPAPPAPTMGTQAPAVTPPPSPASSGEISLVKGRSVSLTKGQRVSLVKDGGVALTFIRMGLGWDPIKQGGLFGRRSANVDLDASAVLMAGNDVVDLAFYNQLRTRDGSVQHTGDNRTGQGEGDDESILLDLTRIPAHVTQVFLVVTSYEGHTFAMVEGAFCRLIDEAGGGAELARYNLSGGAPTTGMVMTRVFREGPGWKMQAIGEPIQARTPQETIAQLGRFGQ